MIRNLVLLIVFLATFSLLCGLGFWQLERAEQKRERYRAFEAGYGAKPVALDLIMDNGQADAFLWRRTMVSGRFARQTFLLDNRVREGAAGYDVITPFSTDGGGTVLVNRGWIRAGISRDVAPEVAAPTVAVTLRGHIGRVPATGIRLNAAADEVESLSASVRRLQRVDLAALSSLLDRDVWPVLVYLQAGSPGAFATDWPPPGDGSDRHQAYAVQWFCMAAVLTLLAGWHAARRNKSG